MQATQGARSPFRLGVARRTRHGRERTCGHAATHVHRLQGASIPGTADRAAPGALRGPVRDAPPGASESRVGLGERIRRERSATVEETPTTEDCAAVALHRPSRPESIGGVPRAADVYGVALVVLGGGTLPPDPLGHPTDTTQAWRRIPVVRSDEVLTALPDQCVPVAVERVVEATPLPELEHPERAMDLFGPENGSLDEAMLERCTEVVSIPGHVCSNLAAAVNVTLYDRTAKRWARVREAFPPTDGLLRGVRGGYEARRDRDGDRARRPLGVGKASWDGRP